MTFKFSNTSLRRLQTCHPDIQKIMKEALARSDVDMTIVCGRRGREAQEKAFSDGFSRARYGESPHNADPSLAVDVAPYADGKIQWEDAALFGHIARHIKAANAELLGQGEVEHELETIGAWDKPHWQIKGWKGLT